MIHGFQSYVLPICPSTGELYPHGANCLYRVSKCAIECKGRASSAEVVLVCERHHVGAFAFLTSAEVDAVLDYHYQLIVRSLL